LRDHLERGPATGPRALPPAAGFRRSFASRSEEEKLDPAASASSSLASARRHAPLVDFCNRNDPQARPANRRNPTSRSSCPSLRLGGEEEERFVVSFRSDEVEWSRVRGWKRTPKLSPRDPQLLSSRLRAPRAWPQPGRLGHLVSWTRDLAGRSGQVGRSIPPSGGLALAAPSPPGRAFAQSPRGPPPATSREGGCVPLRPRCLPSPKLPSGEGLCPQTVPSLWIGGPAPLQSSRVPFHRRDEEGARGLDHVRPRARELVDAAGDSFV